MARLNVYFKHNRKVKCIISTVSGHVASDDDLVSKPCMTLDDLDWAMMTLSDDEERWLPASRDQYKIEVKFFFALSSTGYQRIQQQNNAETNVANEAIQNSLQITGP